MDAEIKAMLELLFEKIDEVKQETVKTNVKMENDICRRIDSLFDGYKLTHEKQWEMEREIEQLKRRVERLEDAG